MEPPRHDSNVRLAGVAWLPPRDHGAAALRLEICRQLLGHLAEDRSAPGALDPAEIGTYLSRWNEDRARRDLDAFCSDTVRLLGRLLDHVAPAWVPTPAAPCAIGLE